LATHQQQQQVLWDGRRPLSSSALAARQLANDETVGRGRGVASFIHLFTLPRRPDDDRTAAAALRIYQKSGDGAEAFH